MKVYVLIKHYKYEGQDFIGVFASEEAAERYCKQFSLTPYYGMSDGDYMQDHYFLEECEVLQ